MNSSPKDNLIFILNPIQLENKLTSSKKLEDNHFLFTMQLNFNSKKNKYISTIIAYVKYQILNYPLMCILKVKELKFHLLCYILGL